MAFNFALMKETRKKKKITQAQLAEAVGVVQATISDYEKGSITPSVDVVARIASKLELSVGELIQDDPNKPITGVTATLADLRGIRDWIDEVINTLEKNR